MRRSMLNEVSIQEMKHMKEIENLTNKQVANRLGCSPSTVSKYLGKHSNVSANRQAQNQLMPLTTQANTLTRDEGPEPQANIETKEVKTAMKERKEKSVPDTTRDLETSRPECMLDMPILSDRRIVDFQGNYCVYEVDTGDKTVVMKKGDEITLVRS